MKEEKLPFTCPICGKKTHYQIEILAEGTNLTCPFCKLNLTLNGHMWEEVQKEIGKLKKGS